MSRPELGNGTGIDLSDDVFWDRPDAQRQADFARLRSFDEPGFFEEPAIPASGGSAGYYALVRHADVIEASRSPALFSSARGATSLADLPPEFNEYFGSMISMDDPRHARLRRIVSRAFTPRMISNLEAEVERTAKAVVDRLLDLGPCDFVQHVATQLPLRVICEMMGIGEDHLVTVQRNTNIILSGAQPDARRDPDEVTAEILTAGMELANLVERVADHKLNVPGSDVISALVSANLEGERLTRAELSSFFILLVVAGSETTSTAISHALVLLTEHPDQRALLLADFEGRIAGAVEEIIRHASPVTWMRRSVTRDVVMNGHQYHAGDKVLLVYSSANHDDAVFTDPEEFIVTRSPNPHVGFGGIGPHFCLGAHLARREIAVMLSELLRRAPCIRASGEPRRLRSSFINGIESLPCELR